MTKITLGAVGDLRNTTTAQTAINTNFDTIEAAWDNTLSRDGTSPNTMSSNLDMNSNRILNLVAPTDSSQPLRLADASLLLPNTLGATGTSGHTIPFLDGNNTWSGTNAFVLSNASALTIGLTAGNPAFKVDTTTASSVTGLQIKSAASGANVALSVISSASNEALTVNSKGTGTVQFQTVGTGIFAVGSTTRFAVDPATGNVGIGQAPSSDSLIINSNGASVNQLRLKDNTGGHTGALASQNNAGAFLFNNQDNANIEFYSNNGGGEQLIIGTSGNGVKIGAAAPNPGAQGLGVGGQVSLIDTITSTKSTNGTFTCFSAQNTNTGAAANVTTNFGTTDSGTANLQAVSAAGGSFAILRWSGLGGFFIDQKNAAGTLTLRTGSTPSDALVVDASQNITIPKQLTAASSVATPAGGSTTARLLLGTTAGFGIYYGSGAPTVSAASGSIYIRTDNAGANLRIYSNTTGSTTWAAITSA